MSDSDVRHMCEQLRSSPPSTSHSQTQRNLSIRAWTEESKIGAFAARQTSEDSDVKTDDVSSQCQTEQLSTNDTELQEDCSIEVKDTKPDVKQSVTEDAEEISSCKDCEVLKEDNTVVVDNRPTESDGAEGSVAKCTKDDSSVSTACDTSLGIVAERPHLDKPQENVQQNETIEKTAPSEADTGTSSCEKKLLSVDEESKSELEVEVETPKPAESPSVQGVDHKETYGLGPSIPPYVIQHGEMIEAFITSVESPSRFWLQPRCENDELEDLNDQMG